MLDDRKLIELSKMIVQLKEGSISQFDLAKLDRWLKESDEALEFYREFMKNSVVLKRKLNISQSKESKSTIKELVRYLSKYEISAPKIEIFKKEKQVEQSSSVKRSRRGIYSAAASIVILLGVFFILLGRGERHNAAILTDSIDCKWGGTAVANSGIGGGSTKYRLESGLIELQFGSGSKVTIEGPAAFQVISEEQLTMHYGKAYAVVPGEAIGFSIYTENARVIDLGTEFGVDAESDGDTLVQVIKGRTMLIAGNGGNKFSIELKKDAAKLVSMMNGDVHDVPFEAHKFVREIDSEKKVVWHGQSIISLADLLGGGNGFGSGEIGVGINPANGEYSSKDFIGNRKVSKYKFNPVNGNAYVDGVFVPTGDTEGGQVVSSAGDVFEGCPQTSGIFWQDISNKPMTRPGEFDNDKTFEPAYINGVSYGTIEHPGIMAHSNAGITFDLEVIRGLKSEMHIASFAALGGISDSIMQSDYVANAKVVMWVLVDGKVRAKVELDALNLKQKTIEVSLGDGDRYLTLVSTDGENGVNGDWAFWGEPRLVLE